VVVSVLLAVVLSALFSAAAPAAELANHPFRAVLVNGKPIPPTPTSAGSPGIEDSCGVAVDSGGTIYMSDYYHHAVKIIQPGEKVPFGVAGEFSGIGGSNGPCGLAVDFNDNLYVNNWHGAVTTISGDLVDKGPATGVATDPDTADLYVTHRHSIAVYKAPVDPGDTPEFEIGSEATLGDAYGVAVSSFGATDGYVYVADAATDTVKVFDSATPAAPPIAEIDGAATPQGGFVSLVDSSLALDQSNGHLLVADNIQPNFTHPAAVVDEFNPAGHYRGQLQHALVHAEPVGIAVNEAPFSPIGENQGEIYVTSGNGSNAVFPPGIHQIPESEATFLYAFGLAGLGQTLAVTRSGSGSGTVASSPAGGIACGIACEAEFNSGRTVKLVATPGSGSAFAGWSGACTGAGTCEVVMSAAKTVDASFEPAPAPLLLAAGAGLAAADGPPRAAAGTQASPALALGPAAAQARTVALPLTVSGAGTLAATGLGIRPVKIRFTGADSIVLRLRLSAIGKRRLARAKQARLALSIRLAFAPSRGDGETVIKTTATFRRR
jgi:DNA-binding beta-propeller fold protein YncE